MRAVPKAEYSLRWDLNFADTRLYPPSSHPGVWVLRPATQSIENTLSVVKGALALLETEESARRLWIVEPDRVRIRASRWFRAQPAVRDARAEQRHLAWRASSRRAAQPHSVGLCMISVALLYE
jgi:hypothetical protein